MPANSRKEIAIFGGGCFWCTEAVFKMLKGVDSVEPGYMGGILPNPSYEEVSSGDSGYVEVVRIEYDPEIIQFRDLMTVFFASHDPTTLNRQGNVVGTQYRSVIFYSNSEQQKQAIALITELNSSHVEGDKIVTKIEPASEYYSAETYHKDYYANNKEAAYCQLVINPKLEKVQKKFAELQKLTPEQYAVLREKGTEPPFTGKYLHEDKNGLYHCVACDNPLFASDTKFDSGTGWPSFDQALPGSVKEVEDKAHGMSRTEVVCAHCGSHLGHVFDDGPSATKQRYCVNSLSVDFQK
jgi:peptide methionine sulfoxide reductase msrA/msrB